MPFNKFPQSNILIFNHRAFNIGEFIDGSAQQHLPEALAKNESRIGAFADRCHSLCNRILELFAIGLEIPEGEGGQKWFAESHDRSKGTSGSVLRLLYYPALPPDSTYNPEVDIRAGAHSDYGSITCKYDRRFYQNRADGRLKTDIEKYSSSFRVNQV